MPSVRQSFMLSGEQEEAVQAMLAATGLQKGQLYRRALRLLAEELGIAWPEGPKPGRPWPKERDDNT